MFSASYKFIEIDHKVFSPTVGNSHSHTHVHVKEFPLLCRLWLTFTHPHGLPPWVFPAPICNFTPREHKNVTHTPRMLSRKIWLTWPAHSKHLNGWPLKWSLCFDLPPPVVYKNAKNFRLTETKTKTSFVKSSWENRKAGDSGSIDQKINRKLIKQLTIWTHSHTKAHVHI